MECHWDSTTVIKSLICGICVFISHLYGLCYNVWYMSFSVALDLYIAYQNTKHWSWTWKNETLSQYSIIFHSSLQTNFVSLLHSSKNIFINLIWTYLSSSVSGLKFISLMKNFSEMYLLILTTKRISHLWYSVWILFSVHLRTYFVNCSVLKTESWRECSNVTKWVVT